jgi:hypothetical protein
MGTAFAALLLAMGRETLPSLLDARGCDDCTGGGWHWRFERHVAEVDKYP